MITLEAVTKIYQNPKLGRSIVALGGCDLDIKTGDFVSIIGPSGAGKSTLMRIISGLEKPTSGKVVVSEQEIDLLPKKELYNFRRKKLGIINQIPLYNLFPDLTVERNLIVPARLIGKSLEEAKIQAVEILEKLEITDLAFKQAKILSMGESMRVSLAVGLINSPTIILADEPTGQLDKENTKLLLNLLKKINEEDGKTIVVVSHDPIYFSYVSESFLIYNGRLGAQYTQEDLLESSDEDQIPAIETHVSHIDSFSYLFLPSQIKDYLTLNKKVKFIINHETEKVYLENPEKDIKVKKESLKQVEIPIFQPRKRSKSDLPVIDCKNLTKYYYYPKKELILNDLQFQLYPGELVFLIGPSGTGKTTLLNLLSGIDLDFSGSLTVLGEVVDSTNRIRIDLLRSSSLFFSSQYINLYPSMSLLENIDFFKNREPNNSFSFNSLNFLLSYLSLDDIKNQLVENYSEGEKKRASILLGLTLEPQLLLVDEPTANLDEINKRKVMKLLADYVMNTNASVLAVTHDLLSIIPNSRLLEIENNAISKDIIVTTNFYSKVKDLYLSKKMAYI
ncbi:MAG: ATP-binding cassette domain-containing protein [Asgard group archaeon]|nr:ATP-binding cassette domain-containing protein [Asgard group archaeon]